MSTDKKVDIDSLDPATRSAAEVAARISGMSVEEWLARTLAPPSNSNEFRETVPADASPDRDADPEVTPSAEPSVEAPTADRETAERRRPEDDILRHQIPSDDAPDPAAASMPDEADEADERRGDVTAMPGLEVSASDRPVGAAHVADGKSRPRSGVSMVLVAVLLATNMVWAAFWFTGREDGTQIADAEVTAPKLAEPLSLETAADQSTPAETDPGTAGADAETRAVAVAEADRPGDAVQQLPATGGTEPGTGAAAGNVDIGESSDPSETSGQTGTDNGEIAAALPAAELPPPAIDEIEAVPAVPDAPPDASVGAAEDAPAAPDAPSIAASAEDIAAAPADTNDIVAESRIEAELPPPVADANAPEDAELQVAALTPPVDTQPANEIVAEPGTDAAEEAATNAAAAIAAPRPRRKPVVNVVLDENPDATTDPAEIRRRALLKQMTLLEERANAGESDAQHDLGVIYAQGRFVGQDYASAAKWFELSADQGLPNAQFNLGVLYEHGLGVDADAREAERLYTLAAEQEFVTAQYNLGVLYASGDGLPEDYESAAKWFTAAAEAGELKAQYNLAVLYERGLGVEADPAESLVWFTLAGNAGDDEASDRAAGLRGEMDEADLARVTARVEKLARDIPGQPVAPNLIANVQRTLQRLGFAPGPADGVIGDRTTASIGAYQKIAGLTENGQPSGSLLTHLEETLKAHEQDMKLFAVERSSADLGERSDVARRVQELLRDLSFRVGVPDGLVGERTIKAVATYQRLTGMDVDGMPSETVQEHLEGVTIASR